MSDENITCYSLNNPDKAYPKSRSVFYKEQIELNEADKKPYESIGIVQILIFDSKGELFIQKRGISKKHNPGLLDKSIGGHITFGDTPEYTAMVETVQELQIPSIVTKDINNFIKTYNLMKSYLNSISILLPVQSCWGKDITQIKIIDGKEIPVVNKTYLLFGLYSGAVKTVDKEAMGILLYPLKQLKSEMKNSPKSFTNDLDYFINYFSADLSSFISTIING